MNNMPATAEMERAYMASDRAYDGVFILGVMTTGIFCRPSCPARKAHPRNIEYFPGPREALATGYRPCKRCRPMALDAQPEWVSALLKRIEENPGERVSDGDLKHLGINPATARRYFQRHYGMTFQAYAR